MALDEIAADLTAAALTTTGIRPSCGPRRSAAGPARIRHPGTAAWCHRAGSHLGAVTGGCALQHEPTADDSGGIIRCQGCGDGERRSASCIRWASQASGPSIQGGELGGGPGVMVAASLTAMPCSTARRRGPGHVLTCRTQGVDGAGAGDLRPGGQPTVPG